MGEDDRGVVMTKEEEKIMQKYFDKYKGIPENVLMNVTDEDLLIMVKEALAKGKPIKIDYQSDLTY